MKVGERYLFDYPGKRCIVEVLDVEIVDFGNDRIQMYAKCICLQVLDTNAGWYLGEINNSTIGRDKYWTLLLGQERAI